MMRLPHTILMEEVPMIYAFKAKDNTIIIFSII